jgi:carboxyl-terminal processing protease
MKRWERRAGWKGWALLALLTAAIVSPHSAAAAETAAKPEEQLNEVFSLVEQFHYSGISAEELRDAAIYGILLGLDDPYTDYYNKDSWKQLQDAFEQTYVGIGIQFTPVEEGLLILKVYPGSAAEAAGLRQGDAVVGVAGTSIQDIPSEELADRLLGPEGSTVRLDLRQAADGGQKSVLITRKPFHIPTVEYARMSGDAGYIGITSFASDTAESVNQALQSFQTGKPVKSLIIDVRGNPGGYLDSVMGVAKHFIENGALLHTIDRHGNKETMTIKGGRSVTMPVTVLVDDNSASASEVFAGAMQDYGLATIVGSKTFGKGSVQQLIPLRTGGGLRLTVEHYLTPNGHEVHDIGIEPDVAVSLPIAQTLAAVRASVSGPIRAEFFPYETIVNGVAFDHITKVERVGSRVFFPSLALAAAVNGEASWDKNTRSVTLKGANATKSFGVSSGLLLKDGVSYIDLNHFVKAFRNVKATYKKQSVVLELN